MKLEAHAGIDELAGIRAERRGRHGWWSNSEQGGSRWVYALKSRVERRPLWDARCEHAKQTAVWGKM